jgi:hypothetical protein
VEEVAAAEEQGEIIKYEISPHDLSQLSCFS